MSAPMLVAVAAAALAVTLMLPSRPALVLASRPAAATAAGRASPRLPPPAGEPAGWMRRFRPLWCLLAGTAAATFLGGPVAPAGGMLAAAGAWVVIGRAEPPGVRRRREQARADLPHLVGLLASALRAGAAPADAVAVVCAALPGAAAERLSPVSARLALGADPGAVWSTLSDDPALGPLGRTMAAAQVTGAPVVRAVERLGEELAAGARADIEDRARAVGVKAALPLGLCLLPAFVLLGIVPLVAGMLASLRW